MSKTVKFRTQREALWRRDPYCYWCGRRTILPPNEGGKRRVFLPSEATLDHLHSRLSQHRQNGGKGKHVLACLACNKRRDQEEMRTLMLHSPEVLWERSGAYPGTGKAWEKNAVLSRSL